MLYVNIKTIKNHVYILQTKNERIMIHTINYMLLSNTRETIREELINLFLQEKSGLDLDIDGSRPMYKYVVEALHPYSIYLKRPANLNKGFDFIVNVETIYFKIGDGRRHMNPSHIDIVNILLDYKAQNSNIYYLIQNLIYQIYQCQNIDIKYLTKDLPMFINYDGERIPIAIILYCIKWLFIEQDITYWNYSGRNMLFLHLQDNGLV